MCFTYSGMLGVYVSVQNLYHIVKGFRAGKFTVSQLPGCFNGVWSGMALEQTYNEAK